MKHSSARFTALAAGGGLTRWAFIGSNTDITKADFNALVEVLQKCMDAQGIAFSSQNQLLAKLAPMHRDVITVK